MPNLAQLHAKDRAAELTDRWVAPKTAAAVRAILAASDEALDYCRAKFAIDRLIDPTTDVGQAQHELDKLLAAARGLAGPTAGPDARLAALRRTLYEAGPWNDHRPFAYHHARPRWIGNKPLANYLATRRGDCVSMPALFLILAERLGLDVAFGMAPQHVFVRYRDEAGCVINLEATSGANPARDAWYREIMPMSDRAVASGLYLRTLGKREGVALLATTVLEHAKTEYRFETVLAVSAEILQHAPRCALAMVNHGVACRNLIKREFLNRYPIPGLIPPQLRERGVTLIRHEAAAFAKAEALGWEPVA